MSRQIYMDNAATTKLKPEVIDVMISCLENEYGNPSSIYKIGRNSKKLLEESREKISKALGATPREIYFTSGGSESDNWAIKGIADAHKNKGKHIITTKIEHHAVLHPCEYLEKNGFEVTYLDVDEYGVVDLDQLKKSIKKETILISVIFANNEVGTIQPIKEIGQIAKENNIVFHTDAVQAIGHVEIDVEELNIDLLTMTAHKIYGPKGTGALYIKKGINIKPLIHGGAQEKRRRAGTENIPSIVGFAKAVELATENIEEDSKRLTKLRDKLISEIENNIDYIKLNGHPEKRLPGNVNFSFEFIEGESLLLSLDMVGISASSGSACTSGSLDPSHVLLCMGLPHEIAHGSLRLSLGDFNTEDEIAYVVENLIIIVDRLRKMSPLYENIGGDK